MGSCARAIPLVLFVLLAGCEATLPPTAPPENEVVVGLKNLHSGWLQKCEGLGDRPGDATGDLLEDFNSAAALGGVCKQRHNALVEYLTPLIEKAKNQSPP